MLSCKLKEEFGLAPAKGVLYEPEELYALVTKHHNERYGEFIISMKRLRRVLRRCGRGMELLITNGGDQLPQPSDGGECSDDSSSDEEGRMYTYRGDDELCAGWRRVRRVLSAFGGGSGLLEPGNNPTAELVAALNDTSGDQVYRHANRHLPPALQQLGGIVLRPQGDTQRGYVVPTVVLHYATGMAQMAEMYGEDMGAGDLDEWVCRPDEWGVSGGAVGRRLRTLMGRVATASGAAADGAAMPMFAIDTNTSSAETLEVIAAYCGALGAEHVELDGRGLLNTDALPAYPTTSVSADAPPAPLDEVNGAEKSTTKQPPPKIAPIKVLPTTTEWVHPFPYLSASMLLPSAYPPRAALLHSAAFNKASNSSSEYTRNGGNIDEMEHFIPFLAVTGGGMGHRNGVEGASVALKHAEAIAIASLTSSIMSSVSLVKPLEAVFALEFLLPYKLHGSASSTTSSPTANHHFQTTLDDWRDGTLTKLLNKLSVVPDSEVDFVTAIDGLQFDSEERCGCRSMGVCGGYQVEPRLGFIPYKSSGDAVLVGFPTPSVGCALRCTVDTFINNVIAKSAKMSLLAKESPSVVSERLRAVSTCEVGNAVLPVEKTGVGLIHGGASRNVLHRAFCGRTYSPALLRARDYVYRTGRDMLTSRLIGGSNASSPTAALSPSDQEDAVMGHIEGVYNNAALHEEQAAGAPLSQKGNNYEEEAALIRASLARSTDVMKVANFLGMAPLVELCGLVIAILLQGSSLAMVREMFEGITPSPPSKAALPL